MTREDQGHDQNGEAENLKPDSSLFPEINRDVSRRRVLGTIGVVSLAGCMEQESESGGTEQPPSPDTPVGRGEVEMDPNIATLIENHTDQLDKRSYTIRIEYQKEQAASDVTKQLEYLREAGPDAPVALAEESTANDGVERFLHYITPDLRTLEIDLSDGSRSAAELEMSGSIPEITGAAVYDEYLLGAGLAEPYERDIESTDELVNVYEIETHRRLDVERGEIVIGLDEVIQSFELEWSDDDGTSQWIEVETRDIGTTDVDIPDI